MPAFDTGRFVTAGERVLLAELPAAGHMVGGRPVAGGMADGLVPVRIERFSQRVDSLDPIAAQRFQVHPVGRAEGDDGCAGRPRPGRNAVRPIGRCGREAL